MIQCSTKTMMVVIGFSLICMSCMKSKPEESHIDKKVKAMTLEEKVDFIGGYNSFNIRPYPHLGIPEVRMADGPVGVRNFGPSTAYPASINLAASWDKKLAYETGKAIAMEARAKNVHIMLGPGFNIYRFPVNGRNFEYLGEDPYLAGQMAKDYIVGMQQQGVVATAKHYAANNQEYDRNNVSSDMDERTLHEIYLPAFKTAVKDAKVGAVMTAYNPVNGVHMSQHDYLNNQILKGEWGFDGFVMSDWVSTYDGIAVALGGLDIEMPSGKFMSRETLLPAIKSGQVKEAIIDDKVRRILNVYERFNFFENPDISKDYALNHEYVRQVALNSARGGLVLLKNDDSLLPVKKDVRTIAVIGPNGDRSVAGGGGSSLTKPTHDIFLVDAIKQRAARDNVVVNFEKGIYTGAPFPEDLFDHFPFYVYDNGKKKPGANAEFYLGKGFETKPVHARHYERIKLENEDLTNNPGVPLNDFSVRFSMHFTPSESGYYAIGCLGNDGFRIFIDDKEVVSLWRSQAATPGKEDVFFNAGQEYKVVLEYFQGGGTSLIHMGAKKVVLDKKLSQFHSIAVDTARKADMVVMSVGFSSDTESESYDRQFVMPYDQNKLIEDIAAVNDNVVVVLNAGGNVDMSSWIDKVDALLMAWYPGQEGNIAAAEILFGDINPSGRLPASFERELKDNPAAPYYYDEDKDLRAFYGEGIFMGYRYWDQATKKPRFPFGHGLSYTQFEYSNPRVEKSRFSSGETVRVSVDVKNVGAREGADVVQVYVRDNQSSLPRPQKELKAFDKVSLQPGEIKRIDFELNRDAFSFYDPKRHEWVLEPGEFTVMIGRSSVDIQEEIPISIQ